MMNLKFNQFFTVGGWGGNAFPLVYLGIRPTIFSVYISYNLENMRRPKRYFYVQISVLFGTFLSAWVAVTSPVLVELLGLELLTSAFGTLTFVRGCAALLGL